MRVPQIIKKGQRGQTIIIAALLLPVLLGMAGMAVDVGSYASERRNLQNAADSIALAAAQNLPDQSAALSAGQQWATRNNVPLSEVTITFTGSTSTVPTVRATITTEHEFAFMKALGVNSRSVSGRAAAIKTSFAGGSGVVPWTITEATQNASVLGEIVVMKYDANNVENGNFGAIRLDGSGSSVYGDSAMYGTNSLACAQGVTNCTTASCPGTYPATCAETSPPCDGPECPPETGNMVGKTREAVDFRMNNTMPECDTFSEVFTAPDPVTGLSQINPDCNPWTDGPGGCTSDTDICSRRVIIIPVVDEFGTGASDPGTIIRFALMFLEGYDNNKCKGNECEIKGRFVKADISANGLAGLYDPDAAIHFTRLSE